MSQFNDTAVQSNESGDQAQHQPAFGRRLLTTLIDERARCNHPRPFASISRSADPKDGYRDITYRLFANAIDRCAWWIKQHISLSSHYETLIYVGAFDLRYQILANAAVKTGYVMFFISPRNSLDAQLSLIDDAKVSKMLVSSGYAIDAMVQPILQCRPVQKLIVPELEDLLREGEVAPFEFNGTFEEYRMKPWILLHTSGSTGFPKIVTIKHGYATTFDAYWLSAETSDTIVTFGQRRMFIPFPPFHMAGIIVNLACSMFIDATIVLPPAAAPLTAELVHDICIAAKVDVANLPPFILMDMIKNPTYLECLHGLKDLAYGGGPLPQEIGDMINDFVRVTSFYGSTETCIVPSLLRPREHWKYFKFDIDFGGIEFRPIADSTDLCELVFVRDLKLSLVQAIFVTFPDIEEYRSKDLFSRHPTEPGLWRYEGRIDDMIVLSNAEKINPVAMEGTIASHPLVKGALVVGTGRFQTALLIEIDYPPQPGQEEERRKLLDKIWPSVDMANQQCPTYARISRELIEFAQPDKPFLRASKGTIQRAPTLQAYSREITDLYDRVDDIQPHLTQQDLNSFKSVSATEQFLHRWFREHRGSEIQLEQDFFNSGMDSLDVVNLTRQIRLMGQEISTNQIYNNPTIKQLATTLSNVHNGRNLEADDAKGNLTRMEQLFHEFKCEATDAMEPADIIVDGLGVNSRHVILIGSTGSLGPYLLNGLLADTTVDKVTCLNRSTDAPSRQVSKHYALGLTTDFQRVTYLKSNVAKVDLGLETSDREELMQSATHIIFNAWTVDFNQNVSSFKPLLQGVKNVVRFTHASLPRRVRLFFMSSVSVADRHRVERPAEQVHEAPIDDWTLAEMGYGQSKVVGEGLISNAVDQLGIDAAICRLCQLGGPVVYERGEWTRAEWIPSLMLSSKTMGVIPESLGPMDMVDWLPIDLVANICLELLFSPSTSQDDKSHLEPQGLCHDIDDGSDADSNRIMISAAKPPHQVQVWHVVNPNPTLWSHLLASMIPLLSKDPIKPVSFVQWIDELTQDQNDTNSSPTNTTKKAWDIEHVPSLKLTPLFKRLREQALKYPTAKATPSFDTTKTVACSKTLASIPAVNSRWIELWIRQWGIGQGS